MHLSSISWVLQPADCLCCLLQGPATELLEVDVQSPPALFQETSPAIWQRCHDFTGGEASCLRYVPSYNSVACWIPRLVYVFTCTLVRMHHTCVEPDIHMQQLSDDALPCRTQKVLFPANTVMNLLQDLVTREPRLAAKLTTNNHPLAPTSCTAGEVPPLPFTTCSTILTLHTCW